MTIPASGQDGAPAIATGNDPAAGPPAERRADVVVIGGGPAGTTIATLLRQQGWRVTLLEKDRHPRFHIGESLLPMNLPILERLGVLDRVREIGVVKHGAEFGGAEYGAAPAAERRHSIYFADAMDKNHPYAFQVRRSEFDQLLFANCADRGVDAREGVRVTDVRFAGAEVAAADGSTRVFARDDRGVEQVWLTRFVVDASGRDTFLAGRMRRKRKNPRHQSAAIFGHFTGVLRRDDERDRGNIGIYWFPHGWFWMIPLRDGVTSVGAVCWPEYLKTRRGDLASFLQQTVALCPEVQARMRDARACDEIRATGNYSYRAERMSGPGYLLVGDAFTFIDPVFSTGVYMAMSGAVLGAEAVDRCLREPAAAARVLRRFERRMNRAVATVSWFIYRFTTPAMRRLFMNPRNTFRIEEAIISLLAGDVFRRTPIGLPLSLFKAVYLLTSASLLPDVWREHRRRRRNVAVGFSGGTTSQDPA